MPGWRHGARFKRFSQNGTRRPTAQIANIDDDQADVDAAGVGSLLHLSRWRVRAEERRRFIERKLLSESMDVDARLRRISQLRNLEAREAWLVARLEHVTALKRLVMDALHRSAPPSAVDYPKSEEPLPSQRGRERSSKRKVEEEGA